MRTWLVAFVLLAACKGKDKGPETPKGEAKTAALGAPTVKVDTVLAKDQAKPPFLFLVDNGGLVRIAAGASWADVDANKLTISTRATKADEVDSFAREMDAMGRVSPDAIKLWDDTTTIDLATLEDKTNNADDPPPPPEEEESGGTGTAMAPDEGMRKKGPDRAEGQYKMQKTTEDPQLARQQAIDQARAAGILGNPTSRSSAISMVDLPSNEDGTPSRRASVEGVVKTDGKIERLRAMIVIAPTAKATTLIDIVRDTQQPIAVSYNGKVRPLHLQFTMYDSASAGSPYWLEARVSSKGITVEAVPDKPIDVTAPEQLGAAIQQARTARGVEGNAPVDILVDADLDVQRLVDIIVALDLAKVDIIGMGKALNADELARRGHRVPVMHVGQPAAQGDLDKAEIRKVVKAATATIKACYEKALVADPSLKGTVMVEFFIAPSGKVTAADASGVSPDVATCVAGVVKTLVFPKPKGGGGVQVNYPFTLRN